MGRAIFKYLLHYRLCFRLPHSNSTHRKKIFRLWTTLEQLSHWLIQVYIIWLRTDMKTKILPAVVYLKTADRSSMSSLGKATLNHNIANFKFSHTFIICNKLPETDLLFGIDIQKRCSLWYSWDSDKQLFIQREGSFFTYTRNCEQQHNITVVKSTFKIPPRHNGVTPIMIKGHNLKAHVGYFISNQHINEGLDPNIHVIDGMYNIKGRLTLHILVAKYTNKHVTFSKGQSIGHMEPSIDYMLQTFINSLTTQKMIDDQVHQTL